MSNSHSEIKPNSEEWRNIDWHKVERYVFRLQKRIYAASRDGDVKKVRKLQRTLMRSWSSRVLAVRRVTQDNQGKKTAGVDGVKSLSPKARLHLAGRLQMTGKAKPTKRVWIPKRNQKEKRPLGIPTMYDRAVQALVKLALEPEWEAKFEPNSYGFRPGSSCHDAMCQIKNHLKHEAKYVLDADIAKCFDKIDHQKLLDKLGVKGKVKHQIRAWLKSGVLDNKQFHETIEGTPQGGVISPLLANIALHGLEERLNEYIKTVPLKDWNQTQNRWLVKSKERRVSSLGFIRYADDFLVLHKEKFVIEKCQEIITEWLSDIGLGLKPEKTRISHSLEADLSSDGKAGFDFLGYHVQQYRVGKYHQHKAGNKKVEFKTYLTPTQDNLKAHQEKIKSIILRHESSPQSVLIKELNPVIIGWSRYYSFSDAQTLGIFKKQDNLTYLKLRRWAKKRCKTIGKASRKYWRKDGKRNWVFTSNEAKLFFHVDFETTSNPLVYNKVKGDKSPYDGDWVYGRAKLGKHPNVPQRLAKILKYQKGKCNHCGHYFYDEDVIEIDHITPKSQGGKDEYKNLQALHRHCHHQKTRLDKQSSQEV